MTSRRGSDVLYSQCPVTALLQVGSPGRIPTIAPPCSITNTVPGYRHRPCSTIASRYLGRQSMQKHLVAHTDNCAMVRHCCHCSSESKHSGLSMRDAHSKRSTSQPPPDFFASGFAARKWNEENSASIVLLCLATTAAPCFTICCLLFWRRPPAIPWLVVAIIVDTING